MRKILLAAILTLGLWAAAQAQTVTYISDPKPIGAGYKSQVAHFSDGRSIDLIIFPAVRRTYETDEAAFTASAELGLVKLFGCAAFPKCKAKIVFGGPHGPVTVVDGKVYLLVLYKPEGSKAIGVAVLKFPLDF